MYGHIRKTSALYYGDKQEQTNPNALRKLILRVVVPIYVLNINTISMIQMFLHLNLQLFRPCRRPKPQLDWPNLAVRFTVIQPQN